MSTINVILCSFLSLGTVHPPLVESGRLGCAVECCTCDGGPAHAVFPLLVESRWVPSTDRFWYLLWNDWIIGRHDPLVTTTEASSGVGWGFWALPD